MFKSASLYAFKLTSGKVTEDSLESALFVECASSQEKSVGFVPPRGEAHGALVEPVSDIHHLLKVMFETKAVPSAVLKRKVQADCEEIERSTGRKPGKKERREIAEDAKIALLPMAFAKQTAVPVWFEYDLGILVIGTTSQSKIDDVATLLVRQIDGIQLAPLSLSRSSASLMTEWLALGEADFNFVIDRECELKACDESNAVVKYNKHSLDIDEITDHIKQGKVATKLALTYDDRVSFVLTEHTQLKKITLLETALGTSGNTVDVDAFDADALLFTSEVSVLLAELFDAHAGFAVSDDDL